MSPDRVAQVLLTELERQAGGTHLFVGPTDILEEVVVEGVVDLAALIAAIRSAAHWN